MMHFDSLTKPYIVSHNLHRNIDNLIKNVFFKISIDYRAYSYETAEFRPIVNYSININATYNIIIQLIIDSNYWDKKSVLTIKHQKSENVAYMKKRFSRVFNEFVKLPINPEDGKEDRFLQCPLGLVRENCKCVSQ